LHEPTLLLFEVGTERLRGRVPLPGPAGDVWPAGKLLVTAAINGTVAYYVDPAAARVVRTLPLPFARNNERDFFAVLQNCRINAEVPL